MKWQLLEIVLLRRHFADSRTADLAQVLGRTYGPVARKASLLGLKKSEVFLNGPAAGRLDGVTGSGNRFVSGSVPWNKGKPFPARGRAVETQFKKGRPAEAASNYRPIGSLRINREGLLERKVTDDPALVPVRRWVGVHRLVWIETHGPIPAGHVVAFKAGRRTAELALITLDALELVTQAEMMRRNSFHQYGPEIAQLVQLRGAISRQINKRQTNQTSEETA